MNEKKQRTKLTTQEKSKIIAMHSMGKTPHAISRELSRSHHTISGFLGQPEVSETVAIQKQELSGAFEDLSGRILSTIDNECITKAGLLPRVTSAAIALDKSLLLKGQPTSINITALLDVAELIRSRRGDTAASIRDLIPDETPT